MSTVAFVFFFGCPVASFEMRNEVVRYFVGTKVIDSTSLFDPSYLYLISMQIQEYSFNYYFEFTLLHLIFCIQKLNKEQHKQSSVPSSTLREIHGQKFLTMQRIQLRKCLIQIQSSGLQLKECLVKLSVTLYLNLFLGDGASKNQLDHLEIKIMKETFNYHKIFRRLN